jgi:hypothetical protein
MALFIPFEGLKLLALSIVHAVGIGKKDKPKRVTWKWYEGGQVHKFIGTEEEFSRFWKEHERGEKE